MIASKRGVWKPSLGDSSARASRSCLALVGVKLGGWVFGPSRLEDEDRQEDLGIHRLVCLDSFVKLSIVDMLKCTTHTRFMF